MHLGSCVVGQDVEVLEVSTAPGARLRMREVGLRTGAVVRVTQHGPFGGRVVAVGGSRIAVDAATAAGISVRPWRSEPVGALVGAVVGAAAVAASVRP
ncbi:MAG TPA: FeoA family protein [Actinotalea sp.]|jgi:ferrous iron transport protein A